MFLSCFSLRVCLPVHHMYAGCLSSCSSIIRLFLCFFFLRGLDCLRCECNIFQYDRHASAMTRKHDKCSCGVDGWISMMRKRASRTLRPKSINRLGTIRTLHFL
ncbi:hypothetical protein BDN67DRAFT_823616 [Paxillus ammoniavirescens]|nr:hypothetical protein BDN67DRAFT_823616 [Paxillus ammoniavirescens]